MDDTISRRAALNKFESWLKVDGYSEGEINMLKAVLYELRLLPPTKPMVFDEWCTDCKEYNHERNSCSRWNRVIRQTLDDVGQSRWIPCKERLPENSNTVLVCLELGIIGLGIYAVYDNGPHWFLDDGNFSGEYLDSVKAWMPLPEPYEEAENGLYQQTGNTEAYRKDTTGRDDG